MIERKGVNTIQGGISRPADRFIIPDFSLYWHPASARETFRVLERPFEVDCSSGSVLALAEGDRLKGTS